MSQTTTSSSAITARALKRRDGSLQNCRGSSFVFESLHVWYCSSQHLSV